jgi:hypothetical protein
LKYKAPDTIARVSNAPPIPPMSKRDMPSRFSI